MYNQIKHILYKWKANLFVFNLFAVYACWKLFSYYINHSNGVMHRAWLYVIFKIGAFYAAGTSCLLNIFNQHTTFSGITVLYPALNSSILIEGHCLAIPAGVIFVGTILLFKGNWLKKVWFIPMGLLLIVAINLIRLVFVCYVFTHFSQYFYNINHSVIYVIVTYALIFLLIVWFMKNGATQK